jgi:hypothetical protein
MLLLLLLLSVDLAPPGTCLNTGIRPNRKLMLITRDIPALTDPSPPTHQWGFQSFPSAISKIISKYAAICALLLLCDDYYNKIGKYHNRIQIAVGGYGQSAI